MLQCSVGYRSIQVGRSSGPGWQLVADALQKKVQYIRSRLMLMEG
jgi:hypothetical protein